MRERIGSVLRPRKHRPDYMILVYMALLMLFGLIVMYAIGPQRAHVLNTSFGTDNYSSTYFFFKQGVSLLFAIGAFMLMAKIPYDLVAKHARRLVIIGIVACVVLAIAGWVGLGFAQCSLGACRWFDLGPFGSLQPAEFLKFAVLLFTAVFIADRYKRGLVNDLYATIIPLGALFGLVALFVIGIQKDMGTGIAIVAIMAAMLFAAGLNAKRGVLLLGAVLALGVLLIVIAPHRMERITTFFAGDQASVSDADSYHIAHAKIAIGSGGLAGVGIGNSVQATGYLPEAINDSVFAIMGETFGFIGLMAILAIFSGLLLRVLRLASHLPDATTRFMTIGVFGWLAAHVVLNVAAMTGIFPLTGITLPLLSFGGTSMVFVAGALGIVFQLSQYTSNHKIEEQDSYADSSSRRRVGRTRHTNRSRA